MNNITVRQDTILLSDSIVNDLGIAFPFSFTKVMNSFLLPTSSSSAKDTAFLFAEGGLELESRFLLYALTLALIWFTSEILQSSFQPVAFTAFITNGLLI